MDHNTTHNSRLLVLERSSEIIQYFYNSKLTRFSVESCKKFHLEQSYIDFVLTVGDIILGFYQIEDTVALLQQELGIDATTAGLLGADVLEFLAPLSDPNFVIPAEPEDIAEVPEMVTVVSQPAILATDSSHASASFYVAPASATVPVAAVPAGAMPNSPHMPELRTMASDMARSPERGTYEPLIDTETPVYSSKQPEVRTPLSDLPAYTTLTDTKAATPTATPIETPRWGA